MVVKSAYLHDEVFQIQPKLSAGAPCEGRRGLPFCGLRDAPRAAGGLFPSRSSLIQDALAEKLGKLRRVRLARECAKLDAAVERAAAEELLASEAQWPEY